MADKRKGTGSDAPQRTRSGPTIDLTATEVSDPAAVAAAQEPSAGESEPAFAAATETTAQPAPETMAALAREAGASEPPPTPPASERPINGAAPSEEPPPFQLKQERRPGLALPFAAGIAGGIIPAAVLAALWHVGVFPVSQAPDGQQQSAKYEQQVAALQNDLRVLQAQTKELQAKADNLQNRQASAADSKAADAVAQRVATLESALNNLTPSGAADSQLASRVARLEDTLKSNSGALAGLTKQVDELGASGTQALHQSQTFGTAINQLTARVEEMAKQRPDGVTPAQFQSVQQEIANLKQSAEATQKDIAQNAQAAARVRLAIGAAALRNAVFSHAPYQAELASAQALGLDAKQLAPLQRFAASGVPSDVQLAESLRKLLPALTQAATPQASGDFIERLRANAGRLVRITSTSAPAGHDPADVLARLKLEADRADIAAAMSDIEKLPASAQQQVADWVATVKARIEALGTSRVLSAETARALGPR